MLPELILQRRHERPGTLMLRYGFPYRCRRKSWLVQIPFRQSSPRPAGRYAFTKAYLLATAAEDESETVEGTEKAVQGWVDCFDRCELAATVFAGGVNGIGDIAGHPALDTAYQTGREI